MITYLYNSVFIAIQVIVGLLVITLLLTMFLFIFTVYKNFILNSKRYFKNN